MSPKKLLKTARKWEISAASGRKGFSLAGARVKSNSSSSVTEKGHFVIYTADGSRFTVRLQCLSSNIFQELFKRRIAKDTEKALLNSIALFRCSAASLHNGCAEGVLVCGQ